MKSQEEVWNNLIYMRDARTGSSVNMLHRFLMSVEYNISHPYWSQQCRRLLWLGRASLLEGICRRTGAGCSSKWRNCHSHWEVCMAAIYQLRTNISSVKELRWFLLKKKKNKHNQTGCHQERLHCTWQSWEGIISQLSGTVMELQPRLTITTALWIADGPR